MAISITHTTQVNTTTYPDDGTSPVGSNEWNEAHTMTMATARLLGRTTASAGAVEEISIGDGLSLASTTLSSNLGRTANGDSAYTILATDRLVVTNAALTAPRTWTLPAANAVPAGTRIKILDEAAGVSATNTLSVARAGTDTIEGSASSFVLKSAREGVEVVSDGSSKWTITWAKSGPTSQIFTANGTYTPSPGARVAFIQVQGGGGSGGSSAGAASSVGAASGGGSGGYAEKTLVLSTISTTVTVVVGAGGAAPATGNTAGNAGSLSSAAATGMTTISAPGGSAGGASGAAAATVVGVAGGAATAAPTGGDLNVPGAGGFPGWRFSGTQGFSGQGAPSYFGGGGVAPAATGAGGTAQVFGAGGAGALSIGNTNSAGGAGKAGIVMVTEYFD